MTLPSNSLPLCVDCRCPSPTVSRPLLSAPLLFSPPFDSSPSPPKHFTKSTDFYDDSRGWKSKQGGLSSISPVTTDANNMGGLFVRKVGGAASLIVATQKIAPLVFQPNDAHWSSGHFRPVLVAGAVADLATVAFYASCSDDLAAAGAGGMSLLVCAVLAAEAIVLLGYAMAAAARRGPGSGGGRIPKGKTARSLPNRIVMKTVGIVTGLVSLISLRDLLIPGTIIGAIPRDDIYLEWTGALVHSPPPGSVEAEEHGMEAALHVGDRFASRLTALNVLLTCLFKVTSAFLVRVGKDGSGETKSRLIWRVQALGDGLITFVFRLFAMPASSASLDLRWHLMLLGYETFILFLYAYF